MRSLRRRAGAIVACGVLTLVLFAQVVALEGRGWQVHHTVGALLVAPAYFAWTTARLQLGSAFTTRAEARRLVTHGMYARLRHPIYLAGLVQVIGLLTFIGIPIFYALVPILALYQWRRARREEQVLEASFGDSYRAYRKRTWP